MTRLRKVAPLVCALFLAQNASAQEAAHTLTRAPKLTHFVEAIYPEAEKSAGRAASVVLRLAISDTGNVTQVEVQTSAGAAFDAAAIQAARAFTFEPAEVDGKVSPIKILYRYDFVLKKEEPAITTSSFSGTVRDRKTKKPLANVHVTLDTGEAATTDAQGHFAIASAPLGEHTITLVGDHFTALSTKETLEKGRALVVAYDVEQISEATREEDKDDLEIVVAAPPLEKHVVSSQISAEEARRVPGTSGDVLKVVENMPGVARAQLGSGQLVVWGAAPEDTRVYFDGVPLPRLYHQGGFRTVIPSDMVKSVELAPGGWGAEYGRGLGGLLTVESKRIAEDGFHGSASADLLDAQASARARFFDRVGVEVTGRKSWLDALLPVFTSRNIGQFVPIPQYYDAAARIVWDVSPKESVELGGLLSSDTVQDSVPNDDPTLAQTQTHDSSFGRVFIRWKKQTDDGAEIAIIPSVGQDHDKLTDAFGATPTNVDVTSTVASLRASWRERVASFAVLSAGVDAQVTSSHFSRTGSNTSPAREGDPYVFGQAPSDTIAHDDGTAVAASVAPYVTSDLAFFSDILHITPGLRVEPYVLTASRQTPVVGTTPSVGLFRESTAIEPRIALRVTPTPLLTCKAAWGIYDQPPAPADLSPVFGNPKLGLSSGEHFLLGFSLGRPDVVSLEATGFYTTSQNLAVRSTLASPVLAEALVDTGIGRTRGIQFLAKKTLKNKLSAWITYTLSKSERASSSGAPYYLFAYDQTHVLGAVASYDLGHGFEVAARFRYTTGMPRTPVTGAYYDVKTGLYEPLFGALNSTRLPDFIQADLRGAKKFTLGHDSALEIYVDVQNVTNQQNAEELVYSSNYSQRRTITGLPILPVTGARLTW